MDITTVADDLIVAHDGPEVIVLDGLEPASEHLVRGVPVRTLARPGGELLCRFGTVNDVHFGETECGAIDDHTDGPIERPAPGEPPHPETMNRAAAAEMSAAGLAAVIVKGDVSNAGTDAEWADFEACYRGTFGDRLHVVRGNHDAYQGQTAYAGDHWIALPGVHVALLDTAIPGRSTGWISHEQLEWLETQAAESDRPVIVMGHHQQWTGGARSEDYFGVHPDASDGLTAVMVRQRTILGYAAGHTHRHRVRRVGDGIPTIEVGCVKDFPGTWAEYRVYEGGVMQVAHRISAADALRWSERCRHLYRDFGVDYERYALGTLDERCFTLALR